MSVSVSLEPFTGPDALDSHEVAALVDIHNHVWAEWIPGERAISAEAFIDQARFVHDPEVLVRVLARDAQGAVVGYGEAIWRDGEPGACISRVFVVSTHRRLGVGSALGAELARSAQEQGRTGVTIEPVDGTPMAPWLEASGFRPDLRVEQNRALVAEASDALLARWVATGQAASGYSLVTYDAPAPEALAADFVEARHVMNDAPRYEGESEAAFTVAELRATEAACAAANQDWWNVGVRHDDSGQLVGLSEYYLPRAVPWLVYQGDTGVAPAHRGHGLGAWMKAVNHLRLRAERPEVELLQTWNAATNAPMLRINRALGFRPVQTYRAWYLPFD